MWSINTTYEAEKTDWYSHQAILAVFVSNVCDHGTLTHIPIRNTHCQPFNPPLPSMVLCMAVIMIPANMLPTCPTAVKMAVRLAISEGLLWTILSLISREVGFIQLTTMNPTHILYRCTNWLPSSPGRNVLRKAVCMFCTPPNT